MQTERLIRTECLRIEGFREVLLARHFAALSSTRPSERGLFLFASLMKLRTQAKAISTLATDGLVEEVLAISRTMAEVAVNAAYLQFAECEEIDRFRHFDTQSLFKHAEKIRSRTNIEIGLEQRTVIELAVSSAREATGLDDKASSWSKRALIHRGEFVDKQMGDKSISNLVLTSFAWSHRAVHGTYTALAPYFTALITTTVLFTEERQEELAVALGTVSFTLYTFGIFLDRFLHQGRQEDFVEIGRRVAPE